MKRFLHFILYLALTGAAFGQCTTNVAPTITSANSTAFTEGAAGTFTVTATGTPAPVFSEVGALPAGVTFVTNHISGTPALGTAGTYTIHFIAQNGTTPDADQTFTLTVLAAQTAGYWQPGLVTSWQWQLSSPPSSSQLLNVQMYDVDGVDASASLIAAMHSKGIKAVCYISAGTYENWRPDANRFTSADKGRSNGWPGENWIDIRSSNVRAIMSDRIASCKSKGFDALEPDNIDGYTNSTGFPLTAQDQINYNRFLADTAHSYGLSVALKNDGDQVNQLVQYFDFALEEQCNQYSECGLYTPFINAGKAVFGVEYQGNVSTFCPKYNALNFNGLKKDENLTATRTACR